MTENEEGRKSAEPMEHRVSNESLFRAIQRQRAISTSPEYLALLDRVEQRIRDQIHEQLEGPVGPLDEHFFTP